MPHDRAIGKEMLSVRLSKWRAPPCHRGQKLCDLLLLARALACPTLPLWGLGPAGLSKRPGKQAPGAR
eukprot:11102425-Alexandrium_andersonii.AAC.1